MKARLIRNDAKKLRLLCADGTISACDNTLLVNFLANFQTNKFENGQEGRWDTETPDMLSYPGETMAYITDTLQLVVYDISPFSFAISLSPDSVDFLSTEAYGELHNVSNEMIKVYCRQGRIAGAKLVGKSWMIPATAPYPVAPGSRKPTAGPRKKKK